MYLGYDIGTSAVKAVIIDAQGAPRYQASVEMAVDHPKPLWSEQDPDAWWQACIAATARLKADGAPLAAVDAVGLAGQMHGATLLDAAGEVLRPCILWNDGRSFAECAELEASVSDFRVRSGNMAMPGFTAPKLLWVRKHEPEVFRRIARVLLPKDYVRYRMTGELASEMSDASGTLWLDPARREWDDVLIAATGLDRARMPALFEGCEPVAALSAAAARALGLNRVPVVAGAGDNAGGAVGAGVIEPGQAFLSLGTSGVVFVVSDRHYAHPEKTVHAFCHCLPGRWHQMTVTLSAANSLAWLAHTVGRTVAELLQPLGNHADEETAVLFLPYLAGERSPHNDPRAVGQLHGLDNATDLADLTRAVLEGVAYSFCDGVEALREAGVHIGDIAVIGGGARSALWRQILADAIGLPLTYRVDAEVGPALGAARLAMIGVDAGEREAAIARVCRQPPASARHEPNAARAGYHRAKLARYRELYRLTRHMNWRDRPTG